MNAFLTKVTTNAVRYYNRAKLVVGKHSPEILMAVGTVSIVGGVVMVCKEALNLETIVSENETRREKVNTALEDGWTYGENNTPVTYTDKDAQHDKLIITAQTGIKLVRNFAPAAALVTGGIACFFVAHGIMHKRNLALVAAYNALSAEFNDYKKVVDANVDEETATRIKQGIAKAKEDNGDVKKGDDICVRDIDATMYARFFDRDNPNYSRDNDYNMSFICAQERTANRIIERRGHVFLNEVYELYGLPHTKAGAVVGWVLGKGPNRDGCVDVTATRVWRNAATGDTSLTYKDGYDQAILLDFNPDGVILDLI